MIDFSQIPPEFIELNLTAYQKKSIEIKYDLTTRINKDNNVSEQLRELSEEYNLSANHLGKIYYSIKL